LRPFFYILRGRFKTLPANAMTRHTRIDDLARYHDAVVNARNLDAVFACAETLVRHFTTHREYQPPFNEAAKLIWLFLPTTAFINACAQEIER
jgi:hypothetical protein